MGRLKKSSHHNRWCRRYWHGSGQTLCRRRRAVLLVDLDEQALVDACAWRQPVSYLAGDVTRPDDMRARMVETATERYGGVDIFLANAGIEGDVASILDYDEARLIRMSVNVPAFLAFEQRFQLCALRSGWQHYHHLGALPACVAPRV